MNKRTHLFQRQILFYLSLALLVAAVGCGGGEDREPTAQVQGKVTYDGKPLPLGQVIFIPDDGGKSATGEIQEDGTFDLSTYESGDGAIIGTHLVMISAERDTANILPESPEAEQEMSLIPTKYSISPKTSGLTATVSEGGNEINFDLPK